MEDDIMESIAQKKANKRWRLKNRKKDRTYSYRATAKRFIKFYSNKKDLKDLLKLIKWRKKEIDN